MRSNSERLRTCVAWRTAGRTGRLLFVGGDGETPATLAPAVGEHLLAALGAHALAVAVRANTPDVVGLVGALHEGTRRLGRGSQPRRRAQVKPAPRFLPTRAASRARSW